MLFKEREKIKEILNMNISKEEKKNMIANLKNYKTDLSRIINTDGLLNLEIGQKWNNLGKATSWTDVNAEINNMGFRTELENEIEYVLRVEDVAGYQLQYLNFDSLEELEIDEDLIDEILDDEIYIMLMDILGSDAEMEDEAEILVPAETEMIIKEINDCRDYEGYIEVILKAI